MGHYILRRFFTSIAALFIATIAVFMVLRILPGDAVLSILADTPHSVQMREALRNELGLDKPAYVQYLTWLGRIFDGSFGGRSFETGGQIGELIAAQLPVTLLVSGYSIILSCIWALPTGFIAGYKPGKLRDKFLNVFSLIGLSVPNIFAASIVLVGLLKIFRWSPPIIYSTPNENLAEHLYMAIWPVLILSLEYGSHLLRTVRAAVGETLKTQYIRGAKARGINPVSLLLRHAMPPVASITFSVAAAHFSALIGGAIVLEAVFGLPGVGRGLVQAAIARDFPVIQSYSVLLVGAFLLIQMAVDVLQRFLDPRQRTAETVFSR